MIALLAVVVSLTGPAQVCVPLPGVPCFQPPLPIPCIPLPLVPCYTPPEPPPADTPPEFTAPLVLVNPTRTAVTITWKAATDDVGILRYLVYRDKRLIASLAPAARRIRVRLRCGRHVYTVIALDSFGQRALKSTRVRRRCT